MRKLAYGLVAALAIMPVVGGVANAKPDHLDGEGPVIIHYHGSANRSNCHEIDRTDLGYRKVPDRVDRTRTKNPDGSVDVERTVTYRFEHRGTRVDMLCEY